ncbi:MAG TPA: hypothetical protein VGG28_00100 [Kofleriaceae bacterium]|jgi:hypothetical protein
MRFLIALACVACSSPAVAPDAPTADAATAFTFVGDYMLDSTITSATLGSASYASGETIHEQLVFASYVAAQASPLVVDVTQGSASATFEIVAHNCLGACANASSEMVDATVSWGGSAGAIITDVGGSCAALGSDGGGCGWAD